jgi:hypothetical protein
MTVHHALRASSRLLWPMALLLLSACGDRVPPSAGACESGLLPGDLVITEIMADPPGADSGREWFEIYNASGLELDLRGVVLLRSEPDTTDAKLHSVQRSWGLSPGEHAVAGAILDDEEIRALVPYVDYGYSDGLGDMGNDQGRLVVACGDTVIDEALYVGPTSGAARGFTGDRTPDAAGNDDLALWCDATTELDAEARGTPGELNDICIGAGGIVSCFDAALGDYRTAVAPTDLVITEIMSNPSADDDEPEEWFEVLVGADFDLNGLALGREPDLSDATPLVINDCMPIASGTRLVLAREEDPALNGGLPRVDALFDFDLTQTGDVVLSYQGALVDHMPYRPTDPGAATNLDPRFTSAEYNDVTGFACDATTPYGDGDLGTPGEPNRECEEIVPPEGQCFDGGTLRDIRRPTAVGDLVITEYMPNPELSEDESTGEWFEILANTPFDLNGLAVGRTDDTETDGELIETAQGACVSLAAGDYAVIAHELDPVVNGGLPRVDGTFDLSLPNTGDRGLWVGGTEDAPLDAITWSTSFAGAATSLDPAATDPAANDEPANFCAAVDPYGAGDLGTPGAANPSCGSTPAGTCNDGGADRAVVLPQPGDLVITEIMPNPAAVGDTAGEWFEILATADVDLNGLQLGDDLASPDATLPAGGDCLTVGAGQRVVLARNADEAQNGGLPPAIQAAFSLTNDGGTLSVGLGGVPLDTVTWSGSTAGAAWTVDPAAEDPASNDDPASWCVATTPYGAGDRGTPGAQGPACGGMSGEGMCLDGGVPRAIAYPEAGDLVITEWMPNPSGTDTDAEWFEVYVGAAVDLNDLQLSRYTAASGAFTVQATLASADCLEVSAGSYVLFARNLDPLVNGGLPPVDFGFSFGLNNTDAGVGVGVADVPLDEVVWTTSTDGSATQLDPGAQTPAGNDDPGNLCTATSPYGAGGNGTPGAVNPAC